MTHTDCSSADEDPATRTQLAELFSDAAIR